MKLVAAKCPSCGANIEVDRSLKFTKCEYCNTEIVVDEAVENLLKVELKDTPTLDNYLKLGARYYENQEYEEAYKVYSKAEEIDPDNPLIVLRRGLSRTMATDYNNLDINSTIKSMKTSYQLMKKMKISKKDINKSIDEAGAVLYSTKGYIVDVYNRNKLNIEQTKGYIDRLEACLNGFIYLDTIVVNDDILEYKIIDAIIDTIDIILGNSNNSKYHLSSSYINELKEKKKSYVKRRGNTPNKVERFTPKEKVVSIESEKSIIKDILCYIMIIFLLFMFLGSIFNKESIIMILLWLLSIISFIPQLKRLLIRKFGNSMNTIITILRIVLLITAFIYLASEPTVFENTYKGEDGTKITIKEGKISIINEDIEIKGTYNWESKNNDYYIHVQSTNEDLEYRYRNNEDGGSLCLLKNNKCTTIYLPIN